MFRYFILIFSVNTAFCSLAPDYSDGLSNPGHHNHWQNINSRPATPENARQPERNVQSQEQPVQQRESATAEQVAFILPIRAFRASDSSIIANGGATDNAPAIIVRVPTYHSLSGNSSPDTLSEK